MGRGIPVVVDGRRFETKSALKAHVRGLISRYSVGEYLNPADLAFCLSLFRFHDGAAEKFGSGIVRVEVRLDQYGKKHFQVYRVDGSDDDISWPHCITCAQG
jgi:hypothetical protein